MINILVFMAGSCLTGIIGGVIMFAGLITISRAHNSDDPLILLLLIGVGMVVATGGFLLMISSGQALFAAMRLP